MLKKAGQNASIVPMRDEGEQREFVFFENFIRNFLKNPDKSPVFYQWGMKTLKEKSVFKVFGKAGQIAL